MTPITQAEGEPTSGEIKNSLSECNLKDDGQPSYMNDSLLNQSQMSHLGQLSHEEDIQR